MFLDDEDQVLEEGTHHLTTSPNFVMLTIL